MSASFPKPARRRSAGPGGKTSDNRQAQGGGRPQGFARPERAGQSAERPRRPKDEPARDRGAAAPSEREPAPHAREEAQPAPLLPGIKPVLELLQNAPERVDMVFLRKGRHRSDLDTIVDLCRSGGVRFSLLEPPLFARIYSGSSQGVVARLYEAGYVDWDELLGSVMDAPLPLLLALDQVQDPGNAGALARTLYALGGAGLVVPRHNGVYLGAAAAKASAGALGRLPVSRVANLGQALDAAKKQGLTIYGAWSGGVRDESSADDPTGKNSPAPSAPVLDMFDLAPSSRDYRLPAVLVLGGEEGGMRPGMEKRCDYLVRVPMLRAFDSLNVAQAGGIIISCFARNLLQKQ